MYTTLIVLKMAHVRYTCTCVYMYNNYHTVVTTTSRATYIHVVDSHPALSKISKGNLMDANMLVLCVYNYHYYYDQINNYFGVAVMNM